MEPSLAQASKQKEHDSKIKLIPPKRRALTENFSVEPTDEKRKISKQLKSVLKKRLNIDSLKMLLNSNINYQILKDNSGAIEDGSCK